MTNVNQNGNLQSKWVRWIARIWGTLIIIIALFVLIGYALNWMKTGKADPYAAADYPFIENLPPLFMLLSAVGLGIAWRWEGLGGAITIVFQLATLPLLMISWPISQDFPRYLIAPYGISVMIAIPGILFLVCWWKSKKRASTHENT